MNTNNINQKCKIGDSGKADDSESDVPEHWFYNNVGQSENNSISSDIKLKKKKRSLIW